MLVSRRAATFTAPSCVFDLPCHHVMHSGMQHYAVRKRDKRLHTFAETRTAESGKLAILINACLEQAS